MRDGTVKIGKNIEIKIKKKKKKKKKKNMIDYIKYLN